MNKKLLNTEILLPISLYITTNTQPIYFGQKFNISVGYIADDSTLNQLNISDYTYMILNQNLTIDDNNLWLATQEGSYGIAFYYDTGDTLIGTVTKIFYFCAITPIKQMSYNKIYTILKQELPSAYNNDIDINSGNYLDNYASANILNDIYNLMYNISSQQYPNNGYTTNWEYALNGTNNLFTQCLSNNNANPTAITSLLYKIPYNTGINRYDLTLFIAKYCFYWTGFPVVVYIDKNNNITIYSTNNVIEWQLGTAGISELGLTTYLSSISGNLFEYLLLIFIQRLFPVQILFNLTFTNNNPFNNLTSVGWTYFGDQRPIVGMSYLGDNLFPFNISGFTL